MRIGEIGLDSVESMSLGSENRAVDDDIEMFSNAPGLSLPALWRKRQRSVLEANERTRLEIELLRERLAHTEARLTEGKARSWLRSVRCEKHGMSLLMPFVNHKSCGRLRGNGFIEQVEVMEVRVRFLNVLFLLSVRPSHAC